MQGRSIQKSVRRVARWLTVLAVISEGGGVAWAQGAADGSLPLVRGVLEAPEIATLSAEVPGRLLALAPREGDRFAKGDELARFDCTPLEAQLRSAEATLRRANLELGSRGQLAKLGSMGKLDVGIAAADAAAAKAEVALRRFQVEKCVVLAPFDGWVVARRANAHEVLSPGEPILDIIGGGTPIVRMIVPSVWLKWLKPTWPLTFTIDETGASLAAKVVRLGAQVDPVSQTVPVFARLQLTERDPVRPGMSGSAEFQRPDAGQVDAAQ
ncbi:efflux RND transporter periplasmic adaptor subunit [Rhodospirillum sp. A1_3_36]|uniref:efflux RND transporter periplasmic adaptor subunit n=1 Tax=Rhodospirillum sp. A1_3_36 TaxID=3391666 RepID=UPI0039A43873